MAGYDYDLFIIGAGSGAVRAGRIAARYGARVGVCENYRVGGTCVVRGCIPKKLLVYASHFAEDFEDAVSYGWSGLAPTHDWATLIANKNKEIDRLNGIYIRLLNNAGVEIIEGTGKLIDAHTVNVGDKTVTAERILVATGGWPIMPDISGIELAISSNEAFELPERRERVVIVGGGYIALEFSGIFNGLGSHVTQLYRRDHILRGFDDDVRRMMGDEIRKKGIDLRLNTNVTLIEKSDAGLKITLTTGDVIEADAIMYATGRSPNTSGIGLEDVGVELDDDGAIKVDEWSRTNIESIYAVGDVTNRLNLTPVALNEGLCFAETVYGGNPRKMDHADVPWAVFSQPAVSGVGLTEAEARAEFGDIDIYRAKFRALRHTLSGRDEQTMTKLIVDAATDRVLGAHMIGPDAPEIIQGIAVAIKMKATKAQLDSTIGIHPTAAEEFVTMREKIEPEKAAAE
jgi:glutathione reductase (NADPH)